MMLSQCILWLYSPFTLFCAFPLPTPAGPTFLTIGLLLLYCLLVSVNLDYVQEKKIDNICLPMPAYFAYILSFSSVFHISLQVTEFYPFLWLDNTPLCANIMCVYVKFFIYSFVNEHRAWFHKGYCEQCVNEHVYKNIPIVSILVFSKFIFKVGKSE